eukprot:jgi/Picre1/29489/NNA_004875.t1
MYTCPRCRKVFPQRWDQGFDELFRVCGTRKPLTVGQAAGDCQTLSKAATAVPPLAIRLDPGVISTTLGRYFGDIIGSITTLGVLTKPFSAVLDSAQVTDRFLIHYLDLLCFLLSGLTSKGTITAEVAFMLEEWTNENATLEFPVGGSQALRCTCWCCHSTGWSCFSSRLPVSLMIPWLSRKALLARILSCDGALGHLGESVKKEYEDLKQQRSEALWKAVETVIPDIRSRVDISLVGTPKTHARYLRRHKGSYGAAWRAGKEQFPFGSTPWKGLYCCGDFTFPGIGLPAAAASGAIAANSLVPIKKHTELLDSIGI